MIKIEIIKLNWASLEVSRRRYDLMQFLNYKGKNRKSQAVPNF
jgi:hypothetical protein